METKKLILILLILFNFAEMNAQDLQLTQFYASPTFLNPAFTGANACSRLSSNYRQQWSGIPGAYTSYILSFDHHFMRRNSGLGILLTKDKAGSGNLRTNTYSFLYSYEVMLTKKWRSRFGMQFTYGTRTIDFYKLLFGDQLARGGASASVEIPTVNKVNYFDLSSGIIFYSPKYWMGFSAHHLTNPNNSLMRQSSLLPIKYSVHGGATIIIKNPTKELNQLHSISPAINYKAQEKFDQVDIGLYYTLPPLVFGLWYRGIPLLKAYSEGYQNNDAIAALVGLTIERLKIGYSYDLTISRLVGNTNGSHEISLSYQFCTPKTKRKRKPPFLVPCPKF